MSSLRSACAVCVLTLLSAAACSSTTATPDGGATSQDASATSDAAATLDSTITPDSTTPDSTTPDSAARDSGPDSPVTACSSADAGTACNTVVNGGTDVPVTDGTGTLPVGTGGAVLDGRYYLTNLTAYPGSVLRAGIVLRQTLELCGRVGQLVNDETGVTKRKSLTFTQTGIVPNITQTCESTAGDTDIPYTSYTATGSTLSFYSTAYGFSATYTKQ